MLAANRPRGAADVDVVGEQDQPARPEVPPEGQDVLGHERVPLGDGVTRGVERDDLLEQPTAPSNTNRSSSDTSAGRACRTPCNRREAFSRAAGTVAVNSACQAWMSATRLPPASVTSRHAHHQFREHAQVPISREGRQKPFRLGGVRLRESAGSDERL